MNLRLGAPVTVLYRGDLYDTAALVGLVNAGVSIGLVAFIGELTNESTSYFEKVDQWLISEGLPVISIHPSLLNSDLARIVDRPHRDWGWGENECKLALRLAGLPPPPLLPL